MFIDFIKAKKFGLNVEVLADGVVLSAEEAFTQKARRAIKVVTEECGLGHKEEDDIAGFICDMTILRALRDMQ